MKKFIQDTGIYILAFGVLSVGIWWYRQNDDNPLRASLELIQEHLLETTEDQGDREAFENTFADLVRQVDQEKVDPGQVENFVANILNWKAQSGEELTPEVMQSFLIAAAPEMEIQGVPEPLPFPEMPDSLFWPLRALDTLKISAPANMSMTIKVESAPLPDAPAAPRAVVEIETNNIRTPPVEAEIAAKRIKTMCEFDVKLHKIARETDISELYLRRLIRFDSENGLIIAIDHDFRSKIDPKIFVRVENALKAVDAGKLVVWQRDFEREIQHDLREIRREREAIEESEEPAGAPARAKLRRLKHLERLKALEAFSFMHGEKADSLRRIMKQKMMQARKKRGASKRETDHVQH